MSNGTGSSGGKGTGRLWWIMLVVIALLAGAAIGRFTPKLAGVQPAVPAEAAPAASLSPPAAPTAPSAAASAPSADTPAATAGLGFEQIEKAFRILNPEQRAKALESQETFTRLVRQEAARTTVLAAARAAGLEQNPNVAYLMRRRSEQLLVDLFLRRVTQGRIPDDFPSEAQMREFYDKNPAQFTAEERIPVWQIFIPVPADASEPAVQELERKSKEIAADVRGGKVSFAEAAASHSAHPSSRFKGGSMGLLKISDLVPEIADQILTLPVDEVSAPLRANDGFHIVRRGAVVPSQVVPLEQVMGELRQRLRRAAMFRLRRAAVEQTGKSAPPLADTKIEEWRLKLRAAALESSG